MFVRKAESQGLARDVSAAHVRSLRSCGAEKPPLPEAGFPEATADRGMCGCEGARPSPGEGCGRGADRSTFLLINAPGWGRGELNGRWRAGSAEPCPTARRPAPCPARGRGQDARRGKHQTETAVEPSMALVRLFMSTAPRRRPTSGRRSLPAEVPASELSGGWRALVSPPCTPGGAPRAWQLALRLRSMSRGTSEGRSRGPAGLTLPEGRGGCRQEG